MYASAASGAPALSARLAGFGRARGRRPGYLRRLPGGRLSHRRSTPRRRRHLRAARRAGAATAVAGVTRNEWQQPAAAAAAATNSNRAVGGRHARRQRFTASRGKPGRRPGGTEAANCANRWRQRVAYSRENATARPKQRYPVVTQLQEQEHGNAGRRAAPPEVGAAGRPASTGAPSRPANSRGRAGGQQAVAAQRGRPARAGPPPPPSPAPRRRRRTSMLSTYSAISSGRGQHQRADHRRFRPVRLRGQPARPATATVPAVARRQAVDCPRAPPAPVGRIRARTGPPATPALLQAVQPFRPAPAATAMPPPELSRRPCASRPVAALRFLGGPRPRRVPPAPR